MITTYYGKASIRLAFGEMVIAINPISKEAESKSARFAADIILSSLNASSFNGIETVAATGKKSFPIVGPGEYELAGVFIRGYQSEGPQQKINTIYTIILEGMKICHLGALAEEPSAEVVEEISGADILFVPIGEEETLSPAKAAKISSALIPRLLVPVLYGGDENSKILSGFLQEIGADKTEALAKLSLKKKDLENKEAEVVVLKTS